MSITLMERYDICSSTDDNFDGIDFSEVNNIMKYSVSIQRNGKSFLIQLRANIVEYIETLISNLEFENIINNIVPINRCFFKKLESYIWEKVYDKFNFKQLQTCSFSFDNAISHDDVISLLAIIICSKKLFLPFFIDCTYKKKYKMINSNSKLFAVNVYYAHIMIESTHLVECITIDTWYERFSQFTYISSYFCNINNIKLSMIMDVIAICSNSDDQKYKSEFLRLIDNIGIIELFVDEILEFISNINIKSTTDIENDKIMQIISIIPITKKIIKSEWLIYFYMHLFEYGFKKQYVNVYKYQFTTIDHFIIENFEICVDNMDVLNQYINCIEISAEVKQKIEQYHQTLTFVNEFQQMKINVRTLDEYTKPPYFDKLRCNFNVVHLDNEKPEQSLTFLPELNGYINIVRTFCKKKFIDICHAIQYQTSTIKLIINGKTIQTNLVRANILLGIASCKNPTILYLKSLFSQYFIDELFNLCKLNYVKFYDHEFSFDHLPSPIIIENTPYFDNCIDENISDKQSVKSNDSKNDKDHYNMLLCYIVKCLKKKSNVTFSKNQIIKNIKKLEIDELTNIVDDNIKKALTELTKKLIIVKNMNKYVYNV